MGQTASGLPSVLDAAMVRIARIAASCTPVEVATEARGIAAGWWLALGEGGAVMERLPLLVGELRRWCLVAARHHATAWDGLMWSGRPEDTAIAGRRAKAMRGAAEELRLYG